MENAVGIGVHYALLNNLASVLLTKLSQVVFDSVPDSLCAPLYLLSDLRAFQTHLFEQLELDVVLDDEGVFRNLVGDLLGEESNLDIDFLLHLFLAELRFGNLDVVFTRCLFNHYKIDVFYFMLIFFTSVSGGTLGSVSSPTFFGLSSEVSLCK